MKFLVPAVYPAELQGWDGPVSGPLVRGSDGDVWEISSGSGLTIGGPRHHVRQLPVESLVQGCVISILTMTEIENFMNIKFKKFGYVDLIASFKASMV